jgi:hypothetical protein
MTEDKLARRSVEERVFMGVMYGIAYGESSVTTVASVRAALAEVIPFHLDGLREGGEVVPLPESVADWVEV